MAGGVSGVGVETIDAVLVEGGRLSALKNVLQTRGVGKSEDAKAVASISVTVLCPRK